MRADEVQLSVGTIRRLRVSERALLYQDDDLAGALELGQRDLSAGSERVGGTGARLCTGEIETAVVGVNRLALLVLVRTGDEVQDQHVVGFVGRRGLADQDRGVAPGRTFVRVKSEVLGAVRVVAAAFAGFQLVRLMGRAREHARHVPGGGSGN